MTTEPAAPDILGRWLAPFEALFTGPTWRNLLVLLAGAILAPGRRTVTSALSVLGLRAVTGFTNFHRVLNQNRWWPVIIGIDETIERRWGAKIKARGIYRDPVRSSRGHFVPRGACAVRLWRRIVCVDGQRPALDFGHAARPNPLGWSGLGLGVPDRAGTFRALCA